MLRIRVLQFFGVRDRMSAMLVAVSAAILTLHAGLVALFFLPRFGSLDLLRLHYTAELGVDWIADWRYLFVYPAAGAAVLLVNGLVAGATPSSADASADSPEGRSGRVMIFSATVFLETAFAAAGGIAVLLNS